jgi:nucleoside-diphosphate-sugar epimerase
MKAIVVGYSSMLGLSLCSQLEACGIEVITAGRSEDAEIHCDFQVQPPRLDPPTHLNVDVIYVLSSAFSDDSLEGIGHNLLINSASASYIFMLAAATHPDLIVYVGSIFSYANIDPSQGMNSYGMTKKIAEDLLAWWCARNNVRFVGIRLSQLFDDYGLCVKHQPWIGRIIRYAFDQQDLFMPRSDGKRNFLHVEDAASLLVDATLYPTIDGIHNGCSPVDYSYDELASLAFAYNGCMEKLHISEAKQPFRSLYFPDTDLLFTILGRIPQLTPQRWLERIHASESWSRFGPLDVDPS